LKSLCNTFLSFRSFTSQKIIVLVISFCMVSYIQMLTSYLLTRMHYLFCFFWFPPSPPLNPLLPITLLLLVPHKTPSGLYQFILLLKQSLLHSLFSVIPRCLGFMCRRFGTLCVLCLHRSCSCQLI
jgi:hypothetical protein